MDNATYIVPLTAVLLAGTVFFIPKLIDLLKSFFHWLRFRIPLRFRLCVHSWLLRRLLRKTRKESQALTDKDVAVRLSNGLKHDVHYRCDDPIKQNTIQTLVGEFTRVINDKVTVLETANPSVLGQGIGWRLIFANQASTRENTFELSDGIDLEVHHPSMDGWPVADQAGFVCAEIKGTDILILARFADLKAGPRAAVLAHVLLAVSQNLDKALAASPQQRAAHIAAVIEQQCLLASRRQTANRPLAVDQARTQLASALRHSILRHEQLENLIDNPAAEVSEQFDRILQMESVVDLVIEGTSLVVLTKPLECRHPRTGKRHAIGAFKIVIDSRSGKVHWLNQTRTLGEKHAPHVGRGGEGCLGNTKSVFCQLIGQKDFYSTVQMAIVFVESVNLSDTWGATIDHWPVIEEG